MLRYFKNISTIKELKKERKNLSMKLHPDFNNGVSKKFLEMQEEYDIVKNNIENKRNNELVKEVIIKEEIKEEVKKEEKVVKNNYNDTSKIKNNDYNSNKSDKIDRNTEKMMDWATNFYYNKYTILITLLSIIFITIFDGMVIEIISAILFFFIFSSSFFGKIKFGLPFTVLIMLSLNSSKLFGI